MSFTFLHTYSGYSLEKSGLKIDEYVSAAKKAGLSSLGLSDYETLSGVPAFVHKCEEQGIKPIIGEDFYFDNLLFSFFVINEKGYRNLLKFNLLKSKDELTLNFVKEHNDGLAIILSIQNDALKRAYISEVDALPRKMAKLSMGLKHFLLGIDVNEEKEYISYMREFADKYGYKTIAFPTVKYLKKSDAIVL